MTKLIVWLNYKNQCKIIYYLTSLINLQKIIPKVTRYLIWGKIYLDLVIPIKFTRISPILPTKNSPLVTLKLIPSNQGLNPPPGETEQLHVPNCRDREEEYKGQRADPARLSVSPDSYDDACESICFIDRSGNHRPIIFLLYVERFFSRWKIFHSSRENRENGAGGNNSTDVDFHLCFDRFGGCYFLHRQGFAE